MFNDATDCLLSAYRERSAVLRSSIKRIGHFTVVRLDAYCIRLLGPDDPGGHYASRLAVGEVDADWIEPSGQSEEGDTEVLRLDNALLPEILRAGDHRFKVEPAPVLDTDSMDTTRDTKITAITPLVVTTRTVDWSYGHGTPHGWGLTKFEARWVSDARRVAAEDLFEDDKPWRAVITAYVNTKTDPYTPWMWNNGKLNYDIDVQSDGFAINVGYVDGYGGGEKIVLVPWVNLKPYLSERGQQAVDSLGH